MGRVIKKDEQPDVTSASFDEVDLHAQGTLSMSPSRIPAEMVDSPADSNRSDGEASSQEHVLRADETRPATQPVPVEPVTPEVEDAQNEQNESVPAPDEEAEHEPASQHEPSEGDAPPTRSDAEWQEHLEEAVEAARTEGYEAGREDGYEAGYDEGYAEAEAALRAEWEEKQEALIEDTTRFEEVWARYVEESESRLVELALQLAEAIVDAPLADSLRRASEEALTEAVVELAKTPPITITVHPVDFQRLQESGLAEHLTEKYDDLQLESDPECAEGDWSVSSPAGVVRRRRSEVVETLREHLSLSASASDDA